MNYSQYEEQDIIANFFKDQPPGRFLDIGAGNGQKGSNSLGLVEAGWSGICVEPHPHQFIELFERHRKNDRVALLHCAVSDAAGPVEFNHHNDQLSTGSKEVVAMSHMRPFFWAKYWVASITPDMIGDIVGWLPFDFVSVDCEGMDIAIVSASARLLEKTKLLCYEHDMPGSQPSQEYSQKWAEALKIVGFTRVVGRTRGNTFVTRNYE